MWHFSSGGTITPAGLWKFEGGGYQTTVWVRLHLFGSETLAVHHDLS
jgi:hypothetical protein